MARRVEDGAVSIFAVVFAALLLTVLTIGFIKIMLDDQQRSTKSDLSQSALDSAMAGVEDAKRALRLCQSGDSRACEALYDDSRQGDCQVVRRVFSSVGRSSGNDKETIIRSDSSSGESFDQAYTCVNIESDTEDYLYTAQEGVVESIPLRATADVSKISIEWYTQDDNGDVAVSLGSPIGLGGTGTSSFPAKSGWGSNAPPAMRSQVIRPGSNFTMDDLDKGSRSQTAFVRPGNISSSEAVDQEVTLSSSRPADSSEEASLDNSATNIMCSQLSDSVFYSCKAILNLGSNKISRADSSNALLRLTTIYKGASVRVQLLNSSGEVVKFRGVQPLVDSTGRASNLYRRVEARIKMGDKFPYPNYVADVKDNLCKNFSIHQKGHVAGTCAP